MLDSNHFRSDSKIIDGWGAENISLTNNTFILSGNGFYVLSLTGNNMTIANNDILHSGDRAYSEAMRVSGRNVRIINNSMDFGGIDISWADDPWTWVIENNTLGEKPIFAFIGDSNAGVTGPFAQVILLGVENFTLQNSLIAWREETIPWKAVLVLRSRNVVVRSNNISAVGSGIYIQESDNVSVINNRIENISTRVGGWDVGGVILYQATHIRMRNNTMAGGVTIHGWSLDEWTSHDIDSSNVIGDKPILYVVNMSGETFSGNYGQVILANVTNVVVRDMRVEDDGLNHNYPVQLSYATNVVLENLSIAPWWWLELDDLENVYRLTITSSDIRRIAVNSWDEMWNLTIQNSNITYLYLGGCDRLRDREQRNHRAHGPFSFWLNHKEQ